MNDPEKDVLVMYHSPECGNCVTLAPIWAEFAKEVEHIDDLVIANFDVTANEVRGLETDLFPTIKFYPKGDKSGKTYYKGEREKFEIQRWLYENSSAYQAGAKSQSEL